MDKIRDLPKILLDADVISHLITGSQILILAQLYPGRLVLLDIVEQELNQRRSFIPQVAMFIKICNVEQMSFPVTEKQIALEYARLVSREFRGKGESACMAVARFRKHFLASSNLKDIKSYCQEHSITYLTTMDIIYEAWGQKLMTEAECDSFIGTVKGAGSKLPCNSFKDFVRTHKT